MDFSDDAVKLLAAHGITFLPDDSGNLDATGLVSDPSRTFALTEAGKLALGIANNGTKSALATTTTSLNRKPTITRIVRLNTSGMKSQTLKLAPAGSSATSVVGSATGNGPKIIKVTPEQFAALKAGDTEICFIQRHLMCLPLDYQTHVPLAAKT